MKRIFQFLIFIFLILPPISLQAVTSTITYDQSKINPIRNLPEKPSKVYTGKHFTYELPKDSGSNNIITKYVQWLIQKIYEILNHLFDFNKSAKEIPNNSALTYALLFILVTLIIVGIFFFIKRFRKTIGRNDKDILSAEEVEKNIDSVNFDQLIQNAIAERNYRLAIRFYYLKSLKLMADKNVIEYNRHKTNYDYFYEIKNPNLKNLFKETSLTFDYLWYGDYSAQESDFLSTENKFSELQQLISKL